MAYTAFDTIFFHFLSPSHKITRPCVIYTTFFAQAQDVPLGTIRESTSAKTLFFSYGQISFVGATAVFPISEVTKTATFILLKQSITWYGSVLAGVATCFTLLGAPLARLSHINILRQISKECILKSILSRGQNLKSIHKAPRSDEI